MSKRVRSFLGLVSVAVGGSLVYASSSGLFSASADTTAGGEGSTTLIVILFIAGVILISFGVMVSLFLFASNTERR